MDECPYRPNINFDCTFRRKKNNIWCCSSPELHCAYTKKRTVENAQKSREKKRIQAIKQRKKFTNVGDKPTIACEILESFSEPEVLEKIEAKPYYNQYAQYRKTLIDDCLKAGKIAAQKCPTRPYLKDKLLVGTESDPFDSQKASHIVTRYVANLVHLLYPPDLNPDGSYKTQFHARNAHYRLLSENIAIPVYDKEKGWQLTKYTGEQSQWQNLKEALTDARNAGLIPFAQMRDERVLFEIKPPEFKVGRAKNDTYQPNVTLDVPLSKDFALDVDVPQVIFYSEKSEMGYVLETLAKKYNVAYFLGRGQMSTSNAYQLYQFIKERGDKAIIFTLCDYDSAGLNIAQSLARKLQFHRMNDRADTKPSVIVHQFMISPNDAKELEAKGLEMGVKLYKEGDDQTAKKIYELAALDVFAHDQGMNLTDYFEKELLKVLKHDPSCLECSTLISHDQIRQRQDDERQRLERQIQSVLNEVLNRMPNKATILRQLNIIPNADGSIDVLKYITQLKAFFTTHPSFVALETATQQVKFTPRDIIQRDFGLINEKVVDAEALMWQNEDYAKATERLNKYKADTKDIIQYANPEVQRQKEQQRQLDIMETEKESDQELAKRILDILDNKDKVESYHALVAILNNDPEKPSNYYIGEGGQFQRVMKDLKHSGQITFLPIQIGERKAGWYKGLIDIPIAEPIRKVPKFSSTIERNKWELETYGTKEKRDEALASESKRLFSALNPKTKKFWTLEDIGDVIGGYSATAVFKLLKKSGADTKRIRNWYSD